MDSVPVEQYHPTTLGLVILTVIALGCYDLVVNLTRTNVPFASRRAKWEPRLSANLRYFWNAKAVIDEGYRRLQDKAYRFMRTDGDIIVLPPSFLDELQSLPRDVANATDGNMHNLLGSFTGLNILLDTDLHFRIIRSRLTRNLEPAMEAIQDELSYSLDKEFSGTNAGWTPLGVYHTLLKVVARTSARAFVGKRYCRENEWLEIVTEYTENLFRTVVFTRLFPKWSYWICVHILPFYWRGRTYIRKAKRFLAPTISDRLQSVSKSTYEKDYPDEQEIMLSYMVQEARGPEQDPEWLSQLNVILALASIHTVQMSIVHILYDLISHPEYIPILREEIVSVYKADNHVWTRHSYNRLAKLDSLMRESQRLSPPQFLSFHRIMKRDFVLSDGTKLPKDSHVCMATQAIQNDPSITPDPITFDPLRYYKLRQRPGEEHMHQFANADRTALNFGYGKNACPGRFFASLEIKIIVTRLLMEFDMESGEKAGRPRNSTVHEFIVPDMKANIWFKKRRTSVGPNEPF